MKFAPWIREQLLHSRVPARLPQLRDLKTGMPRQRRACRRHGVIQSSAHRFLDECADLGLFGGGNFTSAKAVGHMAPSSRFAETLVRDARVCQGRQGRLLLPTGPLALMIAWSRS